MHDYIVLDAQSFVGGRVQHVDFCGNNVELGANWIYGKGNNPIYLMATKHGLVTAPNDKANIAFYDDHGYLNDQSVGKNIYHQFEDVKTRLVQFAEKRLRHQQVDLPSRSALHLLDWIPNTPLKAAVEYFNIDWEFSEPAEICSLDYATGTVDTVEGTYPLGNEFVVDQSPHNVTILTDSGDIIEADYAVCTFSLGVLQSDLFALYANNATQHGGYYTVWQNLNAPGYLSQSSQPILMVTTTHIESQRIERMSNHQVKVEIQEVLDTMFSNSEPIQDILIPRWHQHPLFRGSYSNWPIGASREHHANMRAPLENRLWFAGEAMSADYYGFLHGAWLEGQSVAHDVLQCLEGTCPDHAKYEYVTGCDSNQMKFIKSTPRFIHQHFS
ncbi:hypothetical protein G6F57_010068 [Rhizopus arrhizus]|uniref:Amine oxidase domain-containing protein n=1 Tax=Rhizopus oryzae TaxID=64495 RepID=A0A9P7BTF9_RHIOR|nr:hypothetical protein G6F23_005884 [Rhizopus arrhizus]KAG1417051.1 hypothetical protein G6F58_005674 [Rhizopus delemar]KAG0785745.1 hypothetical protein G6F21_009053 [Rhizopus arrhizus]KAG0791482.1 hypothetical protein G6F22_006125 [Rhizopus arrhizus]KAG0812000.1 hypothetical protein G6F20_006713 [Rhizopus arrhizus]